MVTGAASGIGAAIAEAAGRAGYRVVLADIDEAAAEARAAALAGPCRALGLDVRRPEAWAKALEDLSGHEGLPDVLVNNAGLAHSGRAEQMGADAHRHMIEVNLLGVINGTTALLPAMLERASGHIINIASLASFVPMPGLATYSATKHAVRAFTNAVALEQAGSKVAFTVVCPGPVDTPMLARQIDDDMAALSFADSPIPAVAIAQAVLRAMVTRPREVLVPAARGRLLSIAGLFPGLVARMLPLAWRRGRRQLDRLRDGDR